MVEPTGGWSLIAHGGAKDIPPEETDANRSGLAEAIACGSRILSEGGSALDAVEAAVKLLELNPAYNAGLYGSVKNADGIVEMDASIMDGGTRDIGAVAGLQNIRHPVTVARALLREKTVLLAGVGANRFAQEQGFVETAALEPPEKFSPGCDTVGCVARDMSGALAVATSTGGLTGKKAGRVGDSPLPGCGFYADTRRGAVSASGEGEAIARVMLAAEFINALQQRPVGDAVTFALDLLDEVGGEAGLIAIDRDGRIGWDHTSGNFAVAYARHDAAPKIYLKKEEETDGESG